MLELIMLIMGIVILVTGRYSVSKGKVVTGGSAVLCGFVLVAPIPLTLLILWPSLRAGKIGYPVPGLFIELVIVLLCWGASSAIAQNSPSQAASEAPRLATSTIIVRLVAVMATLWLVYDFWKYRNGPYVSAGTALFDSLPLVFLIGAIVYLRAMPTLNRK